MEQEHDPGSGAIEDTAGCDVSGSTAERIVEMLCAGNTQKQVQQSLGLSAHMMDLLLRKVAVPAGLPRDKRTYLTRRDEVLGNLEKWRQHRRKVAELERAYRNSLAKFD